MISALAPGKMILLGEYAVLEGAPALVCAVDRYARVQAAYSNTGEHFVQAASLGIEGEPFVLNANGKVRFNPTGDSLLIKRLGFFAALFESLYPRLIEDGKGIKLALDTADFYSQQLHTKFGFGSSAALTVAITAAIDALAGKRLLSKKEILHLALQAHHQAQGKIGSGIDVAASIYGGVITYRKDADQEVPAQEPQNVPLRNDIPMLVVWTGKSASTRSMVGAINGLKTQNPGLYRSIMDDLTTLSVNGIIAYRQGSGEEFLRLVNDYHRTMDKLGKEAGADIVSTEHAALFELCTAEGAAYKPSGAGGGDIGIAFCRDDRQAEFLKQKIVRQNFNIVPVAVASEGIKQMEEEGFL